MSFLKTTTKKMVQQLSVPKPHRCQYFLSIFLLFLRLRSWPRSKSDYIDYFDGNSYQSEILIMTRQGLESILSQFYLDLTIKQILSWNKLSFRVFNAVWSMQQWWRLCLYYSQDLYNIYSFHWNQKKQNLMSSSIYGDAFAVSNLVFLVTYLYAWNNPNIYFKQGKSQILNG